MLTAQHGARIKVWPNVHSTMGELSGGGGGGRVNNITFDGMQVSNVEWAVLITQCYAQKDLAKCRANPSKLTISNIVIKNISGTTSRKHDPLVGSLVCSGPSVCRNIAVSNVSVKSPSGGRSFECKNVQKASLKVACK
jgi:galacturan 1,4-alpha-galacturonidase